MRTLSPFALVSLALALAGCPSTGPTVVQREPVSARNLYPMAAGYIWTYDIDTQTGMSSLGITRVREVQGNLVSIAADGAEAHTYELREEGIFQPATETWLLRDPIAVGQSWPSTHGRTARIESVTETVDVTDGHYENCVLVVEEGGDAGLHLRTTYCQDVGPVIVESRQELITSMTGGLTVTGRLRAHQQGEDDE
ncbi:MAG: hypothetical protein U0234_24065 [Sandaracinus sp.]